MLTQKTLVIENLTILKHNFFPVPVSGSFTQLIQEAWKKTILGCIAHQSSLAVALRSNQTYGYLDMSKTMIHNDLVNHKCIVS